MSYDREALVSILTNRIAYAMHRQHSGERPVFDGPCTDTKVVHVSDEFVAEVQVAAEALLDQELQDEYVLRTLCQMAGFSFEY
jgi:hypothetical protein